MTTVEITNYRKELHIKINVMTRTGGDFSFHPMDSKNNSIRGGINGSDELANMWQPINKISF